MSDKAEWRMKCRFSLVGDLSCKICCIEFVEFCVGLFCHLIYAICRCSRRVRLLNWELNSGWKRIVLERLRHGGFFTVASVLSDGLGDELNCCAQTVRFHRLLDVVAPFEVVDGLRRDVDHLRCGAMQCAPCRVRLDSAYP